MEAKFISVYYDAYKKLDYNNFKHDNLSIGNIDG